MSSGMLVEMDMATVKGKMLESTVCIAVDFGSLFTVYISRKAVKLTYDATFITSV